jgi:SNF2 family DNA or RNA helicase
MSGLIRDIPPLFPDQVKSIAAELKHGVILDFSEPGTGKTRVRIAVFGKRRVAGGKCCLVLGPRSLLRSAWEADVAKYANWLKVSVAFANNREKAFQSKADMYVTNHDASKWLAKQPDSFFAKFDYLVVDESDAYKHHTSQRSKALNKIKKHFKYRAIMNGYPTTNGLCDIWNQVQIVDDGKRLGKSFFAFRSAVCEPQQVGPMPNMVKWVDREGTEERVGLLLKDISLKNVLKDVPGNRNYTVPFYLTQAHMDAYKEMKNEAVLQLKSGEISAVNAAVMHIKLLQIASGAAYDDAGNYHVISKDRYELVADLAAARKNTVIFFLWKHQRDLLIEALKARDMTYMVIDGSATDTQRAERIAMYENGMFRSALLHPKSAAHGLTLVRGKATIWPGPTHDLSWWLQGNRRIHRAGQRDETETINVIGQDTYDENVFAHLGDKNVRLIDLLRSIT